MESTIVLVGAGIADASPSLVADAIAGCTTVVCRTLRHPGLSEALAVAMDTNVPLLDCDDLYDQAETFDELYPRIVDRLRDLAAIPDNARIAYVVPGSPAIAEQSVQLLLAQTDLTVEIGAGLGLIDYASLKLRYDPARGLKIVDALELLDELPAEGGTFLVLQCYDPMIARDIVSAVRDRDGRVHMLYHLGLTDEHISEVDEQSDALNDCDHLTSLWISDLSPQFAQLTSLLGVVHRLRSECPWDAEQTHRSLARHLLEEAHEVIDAIDELELAPAPSDALIQHLEEELGDLLLQVLMHAEIGRDVADFDLESIAQALRLKLIRRHPHVFADVNVDSADEVVANWETIKADERKGAQPSRVPETLPAALRLQKAYRKATGLGQTPATLQAILASMNSENQAKANFLTASLAALADGVDLEEALRHLARLLEGDLPRNEVR
jgi:tetrapyrrole methylase family protein/MazG family protein